MIDQGVDIFGFTEKERVGIVVANLGIFELLAS